MEILVLHILSAGLYFVLLVYLFFRKIKTNKFLIIAILLSLNWNMQGIQGNWLLDEYTANPYSYFFMHYDCPAMTSESSSLFLPADISRHRLLQRFQHCRLTQFHMWEINYGE